MALTEHRRVTDFTQLVKDINVEITDILYIPVFDSFEDLGIGDSDPDKPGAIAAYMDGDSVKLAVYNGDGTWSQVGTESGPSYTSDPSLPSGGGFLAYLRSNYTSANPGDVVYREGTTQLIKCTCYYVDANPALNKWSKIIETIE